MKRLNDVLKVAAPLAAMFATMALSTQASAEGQAGATYRVTATVPVACWVRPSGAMLAEEGRGGQVVEACNSPGGFTVSAQYRPLEASESARLVYAGQSFDLGRNGQQLLRRSSIAAIRTVSYRFDQLAVTQPLVLALTIQPI